MEAVDLYHHFATAIVRASGMSDTMMHMNVGMAIYLLGCIGARTRRGSIDALLLVVVAECANELLDRAWGGSWRWSDTLGDVVATLGWPTLSLLAARYRRRRWQRASTVAVVQSSPRSRNAVVHHPLTRLHAGA